MQFPDVCKGSRIAGRRFDTPVAIASYRIPPSCYTLPDGFPRFIMFEFDTASLNNVSVSCWNVSVTATQCKHVTFRVHLTSNIAGMKWGMHEGYCQVQLPV